ncbi:MAG: HAD family hydrolase [Candidatus Binataceae bacterium]
MTDNPPGRVRAALFDFGGTLDWPEHWLDRFLRHYRMAGVELSRARLDLAYDYATRTAYHSLDTPRGDGLARLVDYLVDLQIMYLRGGQTVASEHDHATVIERGSALAHTIAASFVAESKAGLEYSAGVLKSLPPHLRLGVVSNFYGNLDRVLEEAGMAARMEVVADSGKLGVYKPDARIFEAALRQLELPAETVVMVGDSLGKDCAPARRMGMRAVWLCTDSRQTDRDGVADVTISSLGELRSLRWWRA